MADGRNSFGRYLCCICASTVPVVPTVATRDVLGWVNLLPQTEQTSQSTGNRFSTITRCRGRIGVVGDFSAEVKRSVSEMYLPRHHLPLWFNVGVVELD